MFSFLKGIFYLCLLILLVFIGCIVLLGYMVDPNQYKADIVEKVYDSTGRTISIGGKLQWTFYPVFGITMQDVKISNPPSFPNDNFLTVKNAYATADFQPLLRGDFSLGKIVLDNPTVHLIKNAKGENNWQFSNEKKLPVTSGNNISSQETTPAKKKFSYFNFAKATITELDMNNANIIYDDQQQNKTVSIENLQVKSQHIALDTLVPVKASFDLKTNKLKTPISIKLNANVLFNQAKCRLQDIDAYTNQYHWKGWLETQFAQKDLSALNGQLVFSGKNGAFKGIDLYYYSDLADSMINKTASTRQDTHQTPFQSVQGSFNILNGIVSNHDLIFQAEKMRASGEGTVNLITHEVNYEISLQRLTSGTIIKPRGPAIPISLTGDFSDLTIRPNWTKISVTEIRSALKEQYDKYKDKIPESLQQGIQNLLGN